MKNGLKGITKVLAWFIFFFVPDLMFSEENSRNWTIQKKSSANNIALIIANNNYATISRLQNPIPTSQKIAKILSSMNFDIILEKDLTKQQMQKVVAEFSKKMKSYQFAIVFYLGHGFQIDDKNYLIPIDANLETKEIASWESFDLEELLKKFDYSFIPKVVILDACRKNPFKNNWVSKERTLNKKGFAQIISPQNTEIFFSTQKGTEVADDNPYIDYFLQELSKGGCFDQITRNTTLRFNKPNLQFPEKYGQLLAEVCFSSSHDISQPTKLPKHETKKVTIYYDENWNECDVSSAAYYRVMKINSKRPDKPIGLVKDYYITGELQWEGFIKKLDLSSVNEAKDVKEGRSTHYYRNRQKSTFYTYNSNGNRDGNYFSWYPNGVQEAKGKYKDGEEDGKWEYFHENGQLSALKEYKEGNLVDRFYKECDIYSHCKKVFYEDFSNRDSMDKWNLANKKDYHIFIKKFDEDNLSALVMNIKQDGFYVISTTFIPMNTNDNFSISTQMYVANAEHGLVWGYQNWDNHSVFLIDSNGNFRIFRKVEGVRVEDTN